MRLGVSPKLFLKWYCRDTILLRPNKDVGLAHERSLTIWFVESGLEKLAVGHGAMPGLDFRGIHIEKRSGAWTFKPYSVAPYGMGLLGVDPRSIKVLPRLSNDGLFQWSQVLLRCSHPCSLFSFWGEMGLPFRFTYFLLLYSSALTVLRPRVGSIFTRLIFVPSV